MVPIYRVDPEARLVIVFMMQLDAEPHRHRQTFPTLVYQALIESPTRGGSGSAAMGAKH